MTDSSSLANALSEPLRQPFWWAALASIGLHGVLGVGAPTISNLIYGGNSSKNRPGSVGLIELTPAEISRLPQTIPPRPANSRFSIAPVPLLPNAKLAPPLPPEPSVINLPAMPPGMPPPGFFSPLPLPSPSLTAPPPPQTPSPNLRSPAPSIQTLIPQQPNSGVIFPPLPGNFDPIIPPPPPSPLREPPQLPGQASEDEAETLKKIIASRGGLPLFPDGAPVFTPEFPISGTNSGGEGVPKLTQKDPNKRNLIAETPEERARRQEFDRNNQNFQQGESGANLSSDSDKNIAAGNTYVALYNEFKRAYPDLEMTGPTPVEVAYPTAACSQQLEGVAVLGAVVNPQGAIVASPRTIVPTSFSILNKAAETAIINPSLTFPAASTHKLYQLAVAFRYDQKICGGVPLAPRSVSPQPKPAGQESPPAAPTEVKPQWEKPPSSPTKPQPGAAQSPAPRPQPAPPQSPSPAPKPAATQSPAPRPQPAPPQSPAPRPQPAPAPEVAPSPAAAESPAPSAAPSPAAEESPAPEVAPSPAAEESPAPEVAPSPAAQESPPASPAPAPSGAPTEN